MHHLLRLFLCLLVIAMAPILLLAQDPPNILLIIADDLGVDVSNGYQNNPMMPSTPNLDELRATGLTFKNAWATPMCTPTRATIMSGKYGVKTGVLSAPGNLGLEHTSVFTALATQTNDAYAGAVIGKWHISQPTNFNHPQQHGIDHYEGIFGAEVEDYFNWTKVTNGVTSNETEYATTNLTNGAINWVNAQNQPWLLWLAHVAPHTPIHTPPDGMYTSTPVNNNRQKYIAMIEAMDFEIGRLLDNIPEEVLANTLIIYLGDNGTPGNLIQNFPNDHAKGTLYQGGLHVPMIVSGAGVERAGEEEEALVHVNDIYATILEVAGADLPGGIYNSLSFDHLLTSPDGPLRPYNYSEITSNSVTGWTIRDAQYKLITYANGTQEFYDLLADPIELNDLIPAGLNENLLARKGTLEAEALVIRDAWSCQDFIQNGDEDAIDCGGSSCQDCISATVTPFAEESISVYPNPCTDYLQVTSKYETMEEITICNQTGQVLVYQQKVDALQKRVDLNNLPSGTLSVKIKMASEVVVFKVLHH